MNSATDMVNLALVKISAQLVDNLDNEPLHRLIYEHELNSILRSHPWNFAGALQELPEVPWSGPWHNGFEKCYALPGNLARLNSLEVDERDLEGHEFEVVSGRVFTRFEGPVVANYVIKNPAIALWPADFIEALTSRMAARLAESLLKSQEVAERWDAKFRQEHLPEAKKNDARESPGPMMTGGESAAVTSPMVLSRRVKNFGKWDPRYGSAPVEAPASAVPDLDGIAEEGLP